MEQKHKNEVLKIPERLYLRESDMNMLFILDRHEIKVNCCKMPIPIGQIYFV